MNSKMKEENKIRYTILGILFVISVVLFCRNYNGEIDNYNTTILALNYSYGFISRGFIGTAFLVIDKITPFSMMNAWGALRFLQMCTLVFYLIMFLFANVILKKVQKDQKSMVYLLVPLFVMIIATFSNGFNFGRVDMFMISISIVSAMLILYEKGEWLIPIMSAIAVMIHQGYVMMYFNIILVLLIYQFFTKQNKKEKIKYAIIFCISIGVASALFLYLELFSHASNGLEIYDQVASFAASLAYDGSFHETLLAHEILGVDLSEVEHSYHMKNLAEIILLILLLLPYEVIAVKLFTRIYKRAESVSDKLKYLAVFIGSLTMAPDFLIKVDYGRWVLAVFVYYFVVILCLTTCDLVIKEEVINVIVETKRKYRFWLLLFIYPVLFIPFYDVNINQITAMIGHVMNREWLHWW